MAHRAHRSRRCPGSAAWAEFGTRKPRATLGGLFPKAWRSHWLPGILCGPEKLRQRGAWRGRPHNGALGRRRSTRLRPASAGRLVQTPFRTWGSGRPRTSLVSWNTQELQSLESGPPGARCCRTCRQWVVDCSLLPAGLFEVAPQMFGNQELCLPEPRAHSDRSRI